MIRRLMIRHLIKMMAYVRAEWRAVALGVLSLAVCDALQFAVPQILRIAVDGLVAGTADSRGLFALGSGVVGIAVSIAFFRFFWRHFLLGASYRIDLRLREDLYRRLLVLPPAYYHGASTGDLMARATNDIRQVQQAAGMGVVILVDMFWMGAAALGFMVWISPRLTLLALAPLAGIAVLILVLDPAIRRRFERVQERFSELTERLRENIAGQRVVQAYVQGPAEIADFDRLSRLSVRDNLSLVALWGGQFPAIVLLSGVAAAAVLLFGGRMAVTGEITAGEFVAFTAYLGMLSWPAMAVGWVISMFQRAAVSMGRIEEVLGEPAVRDPPADPLPALEPPRGAVSVRGLTFGYAEGSPVLRDVSLEAPPGGVVGIVGRIGSGKSSLIHVLARLWDPPPGTVFVDGMDVTRLPLAELRRRIAWVPQESFLFSDTIAENVGFGRPGAPEERIRAAARAARIGGAIEAFPDGYGTVVGERGVTLSGGERQRATIARALLLDAPILLLDDCLSAVDAETESAILRELARGDRRRTCFVVSHRVSAVEWADQILVLEQGAGSTRTCTAASSSTCASRPSA
jgi:ATP-binding cassette subfamily B protein